MDKGNYLMCGLVIIKLMGNEFPLYTADGGVSVMSSEHFPARVGGRQVLMNKINLLADQQSSFRCVGESTMRRERIFIMHGRDCEPIQRLLINGYAVLFDLWWDRAFDLLSASHSWHPAAIRGRKTDRESFFSLAFIRREVVFLEPTQTDDVLTHLRSFNYPASVA